MFNLISVRELMNKGLLYIESAPSGAGKTSLLGKLIKSLNNIVVAVSHTTRLPRSTEKEGEHYFFVDKATFQTHIEQGEFLEYAQVFDNNYGTSKKVVDKLLASGKDVILEIDWQGAQIVRQLVPDVVSIFILPPSLKELESRLNARGQDSDAIIAKRMQTARSDMSHYLECHYIVVNDDFNQALNDLMSIVVAERLTLERQQEQYRELFDLL
jgi:guanylate kinase